VAVSPAELALRVENVGVEPDVRVGKPVTARTGVGNSCLSLVRRLIVENLEGGHRTPRVFDAAFDSSPSNDEAHVLGPQRVVARTRSGSPRWMALIPVADGAALARCWAMRSNASREMKTIP
jgi:hypothetical protein